MNQSAGQSPHLLLGKMLAYYRTRAGLTPEQLKLALPELRYAALFATDLRGARLGGKVASDGLTVGLGNCEG
jgi:hypothetical protein